MYYACSQSVVWVTYMCLRKILPAVVREFELIMLEKEQERRLANGNKTRNKIGHRYECWMELTEALKVQTHAEV